MKHYLLFYSYADGHLERRPAFREAHLRHAWEAQQRGALILGGAVADPLDSGLLLFEAESPAAVEAFARADPYVVNGLVGSWRVCEWLTVVGASARSPLRPADAAP
ncbi:MAG TPA: YciI-like protein [Steroidobacteraceae bacterium]|nr:YciI-like protein [Steroidobacteraceae bacterium]